jgi:trigger factor
MSFTATVEEVSATRRKYKIAAEQSVVNKAFEDALTEIQKNAEIKGFRKGKVPAPLVKKFFKGDLSKKAYENVVESGFQAAIKDSPLQIVSYPQIETDQTFDEHSAFSFDATVDVNPIVEIEGYKQLKLKIEPKQLKSAEDELVALKDSLLISRSKLGDKVTDGSLSETGDLVVFDLESTFEGNAVPELKSTGASLIIGRINNSKEVEQALTGLAVEGKREFPWLLSTNFPTPEIAGKTVQAIVTLKIHSKNHQAFMGFGAGEGVWR